MTGAKKYYLKNLNWIDAFPNPENCFGQLFDSVARLIGRKPLGQEIGAKAQGDSTQGQRTVTSISQKPASINQLSSKLIIDKYPDVKFILNPKKKYVPLWVWLLMPVWLYALPFIAWPIGILGSLVVVCFDDYDYWFNGFTTELSGGAIALWTIGVFLCAFLIGFLLNRLVKEKSDKRFWLLFPLLQLIPCSVPCLIYGLPFWGWVVMPVASCVSVFLLCLLIWSIMLLLKKRKNFKETYFIEQCKGGIARIANREKMGLAKKYLCKVILPVEYDGIARLDAKTFIIEKDGKKGVFVNKKILIPVQYDGIEMKEDGAFVATKGREVEYFSRDGIAI